MIFRSKSGSQMDYISIKRFLEKTENIHKRYVSRRAIVISPHQRLSKDSRSVACLILERLIQIFVADNYLGFFRQFQRDLTDLRMQAYSGIQLVSTSGKFDRKGDISIIVRRDHQVCGPTRSTLIGHGSDCRERQAQNAISQLSNSQTGKHGAKGQHPKKKVLRHRENTAGFTDQGRPAGLLDTIPRGDCVRRSYFKRRSRMVALIALAEAPSVSASRHRSAPS